MLTYSPNRQPSISYNLEKGKLIIKLVLPLFLLVFRGYSSDNIAGYCYSKPSSNEIETEH